MFKKNILRQKKNIKRLSCISLITIFAILEEYVHISFILMMNIIFIMLIKENNMIIKSYFISKIYELVKVTILKQFLLYLYSLYYN